MLQYPIDGDDVVDVTIIDCSAGEMLVSLSVAKYLSTKVHTSVLFKYLTTCT